MDWVSKRYECSLETSFRKLKEVVDSDVKSVSKLERSGVTFKLDKMAPVGKITVERSIRRNLGEPEVSLVVFELMKDEIAARSVNPDKLLLSAKPRLNPDGECLLSVAGDSDLKQLWQVSQKALDDFFFGF